MKPHTLTSSIRKAATWLAVPLMAIGTPVAALANRASTTVASLTMAFHIAAANVWRDLHNPLRGLTMRRAVSYLEEGQRGAYADLQWLYYFIERRDATLRGGKRSLLSAVSEMDWDIKTVATKRLPPGYTQEQADAQAVTLRTAYDAVTNLVEAIEFLGLAEFRGFSHLEKHRDALGRVTKLNPVDQWYLCRGGLRGAWHYNETASAGRTQGVPMDMANFIVREIDDPINEVALIAFVRKQLGRKDWDGFIESFGIPSIFAMLPQNVPAGQEAAYQDAADRVISNSRGTLPYGSDIKTVDAGKSGGAPFKEFLDELNAEIVMAITSGKLTMLAESGTGTLGGGAHSETFDRVARALARRITSTFQAQFDAELLAAAHPGQPALAYFTILVEEEVDTGEVIKDVTRLNMGGYDVDEGWLKEKTGYPVTRKPLPAPTATPARVLKEPEFNNRAPAVDGEDDGLEPEDIDEAYLVEGLNELLAAMHADFLPVAKRLQAILGGGDDEETLKAALTQLRADLPALAAEVGGNDDTVKAWEAILGGAAANQLPD